MYSIAQKYNRILILLFVFAPFVAFITNKYMDMDFGRIMQLFSFIGVFLLLIFKNNKNAIKIPKYLVFYLLFIVYVFYSDLYRLNREFKVDYLFSNRLIGGLNMMFIIENLTIPKKYFQYILKISKVILLVAFLVIIIQQVYDKNFFTNHKTITELSSTTSSTDRLTSIYSWIGTNSSGFAFIPIFFLVIGELDKRKKKIMIWLIIGIIYAFLSKARWIMVNSLLVFFILLINHKDKILMSLKYLIILSLIGIGSFFVLDFVGIDASGIVKNRILESDKKDMSHKSAGTRLLAFKAFNSLYWDYPIFGIGSIKYGMGGTGKQDYKLRSFLKGRSSQMHIGYLSLFYMYGLLGGGLFLSFLYLLLKSLYQNAKKTKMWAPFLSFLSFALANMTLVYFSVFEMGLIMALVFNNYYIRKKENCLII